MSLLTGHQMSDLNPVFLRIGMNNIQCSKRSPNMKTKYLNIRGIQAFFITTITRIWISLQDG